MQLFTVQYNSSAMAAQKKDRIRRQGKGRRVSRLFGGQNLFNSLPR